LSDLLPRPDVFLVSSGTDDAEERLVPLATSLRELGMHVRHTWKSTRNVGKQLKEASSNRSRFAVILGEELANNTVVAKNLDAGTQVDVELGDLPIWLQRQLAESEAAELQ